MKIHHVFCKYVLKVLTYVNAYGIKCELQSEMCLSASLVMCWKYSHIDIF